MGRGKRHAEACTDSTALARARRARRRGAGPRAGRLGRARDWNAFSDASARFHAGYWQGEPGLRAVDYAETELRVILVGRVRLTDETNAAVGFGPGDAFVVESGFRGVWECLGRVTKIDAVLDAEATEAYAG